MYWNDPKLYSANIPTNFYFPQRELLGREGFQSNCQPSLLPWQHVSQFYPYETYMPTQFGAPSSFHPYMNYGYTPQLPWNQGFPQYGQFRSFGW